jgi:hypothetical protein
VCGKKRRGGGTENKKVEIHHDLESRPRGTQAEHRQRRNGGTITENIGRKKLWGGDRR